MPTRLTPLEVSTLARDTAHTPAQIGTVDIFDAGPAGFDYERLISLIRDRVRYVPRYRQRIRSVPARLAGPVWADDEDFDLTFHVRRSALPRPGTREQLLQFVGRVMARRLDRSRPLWEMYLVEGLADNRFALLTKTHQCLVDGIETVDIGQVLLDAEPEPDDAADWTPGWHPAPAPTAVELVAGAVREAIADPEQALAHAQQTVSTALGVAGAVGGAVGEVVGGLATAFAPVTPGSLLRSRRPTEGPLTGPVSEQRRFATVSADLADFRAVRAEHQHTINDVVLAVIAGGLRAWLLTRGEAVPSTKRLTALVPMSVTDDDGEPSPLGSRVAPTLMSLPIGEPNPLMRLHQVGYGTQAHKDTGRAVGARSISDLAGFAPTTLHALGVRAAGGLARRQHDLLITNAPGPQLPLFAAGSRMVASYPVVPLEPNHLLAVGVTSYDGRVFLGLNADRDAIRDLDVLAQCLGDALEELVDTTARASATRQPTRKASPEARRAAARKAAARRAAAERAAVKRAAVKRALAPRPPSGRRDAPTPTAGGELPTPRRAAARQATARKAAATKKATASGATKAGTAKTGTAKTGTAKKTAKRTTTSTESRTTAKKTTTARAAKKAGAATRTTRPEEDGR
ncbi:diacylglycerol O-acyltransferase [Friedmanniella endophytica]|uniref:Diacylglycerol O-acyltransferase n=1 Tax=Microlunatus kandeliicorticis TaxID=1759536 RepID=A0A7W3IUA2_9ACTN|nr:wax ester/triacylglycerol synthase family O-acyltransferase [Microlunatus kandeliicorticis]MBA8795324.1 diacylglycerol O-acyltransferase [Microlunatus kandeliicorticis]